MSIRAHARRSRVVLAFLALCSVITSGCGLFMVHRQPGHSPDSRMLVLRSEADDIDRWSSGMGGSQQACTHWQAIEPNEDYSKRVRKYARIKAELECAAAERAANAHAEAQRREAEHLAQLRAWSEDELAQGKCVPENAAMFQAWALFIKDAMKLRFDASGQPKIFSFVGHDMVVADESGVDLRLDTWMSDELHLFAFGRLPVELEVRDAAGTRSTLASPYENQVTYRCSFTGDCVMAQMGDPERPEERASRVVLARGGVGITVKGQGCVLVMGFAGG